jgi:hypothetical protein
MAKSFKVITNKWCFGGWFVFLGVVVYPCHGEETKTTSEFFCQS